MQSNKLLNLLRRAGVSHTLALSVVHDAQSQAESVRNRDTMYRKAQSLARATKLLLAPLNVTIRSLQSAQARWSDDNRTLYASYLALLLRTRVAIRDATAATQQQQRSLSDIHAERIALGLASDGPPSNWASWVKQSTKHKVAVAFDAHYPPGYIGKRMLPFHNSAFNSANARRWQALRAKLLIERLNTQTQGAEPDYVQCIDHALEQVALRETSARAPIQWQHLLDDAHQELYQRWYKGMRPDSDRPIATNTMLAEARMAEIRTSLERTHERQRRAELAHHKRRVYALEERAKRATASTRANVTIADLDAKYATIQAALQEQQAQERACLQQS